MHPLVVLGLVLVAAWFLLVFVFKVVAGFIHLIVVVGLALLVFGFIKRGARKLSGRP